MSEILAIRPFVPATDLDVSIQFYEALGFRATHRDAEIAMLKLESFSFILQNFQAKGFAENFMVQILVRDADAWMTRVEAAKLVEIFGVKAPRAPAMQSWGMRVGFLFDPSGVLWHIAETPF